MKRKRKILAAKRKDVGEKQEITTDRRRRNEAKGKRKRDISRK